MKHLKLFFALFAMLALGVGNAWGAETETITLSSFGWANATVQSSIAATSATISLQKNSASTSPTYYTSDGLRLYGVKSATTGGTISFTPKTGITISKIVFTHTASNSGVLAIKTGTGTYTSSSKTWSGTLTEGNTVSLVSTNSTTKNPQVKITKIVITYETSGSEETTPSLTADPTTIDFGTVYQDATVADKTVAVNFANLTGNVTYSGLSTPFTATGAISATGDKITISADASTIGEYSQTLTIASTADSKTAVVTVKMNVVEKPAPTGTFTLHTGELIEGDYVIYYSGKAMKAEVASNRLQYVEVTPSNNEIVDPAAAAIWHIAPSGTNWTIYNNDKGYAAGTGEKSKAGLVANLTGDNANKAAWTVTASGNAYEFVNVWNKSKSVNANLRNNTTYGFACYATSTGGALSLYRKAGAKYNVTVSSTTNGSVTANPTSAEAGTIIALTVTPDAGYVLDALTVTDASSNTIEVADNKFTMPAADVTISATFKENEKPAATLTLSKNGVEETFPGSWKQDDVVTLPSITSDCVKEFVGWSADEYCITEPEYEAGDEYTLAATAQTLYAVYATVGGGGESIASVDMATYATANNWGSTSSTNQKQITINSDVKAVISEGGNSGKYYTDGVRIYQSESATVTISTTIGELKSVKFTFTNNNDGTLLYGSTKLTSNTAIAVNGTSAIFTVSDTHATENKGQIRFTAIEVVYTGGVSYSDYSTTCVEALDKPVFSVEGGENEAKTITLTATEGTIYYTLDGSTPTASSKKYTTPIVLDECGEHTINAIAISSDSESPVASATYTINLPITNTAATAYTPTEAIAIIDGACDKSEEVYVKGVVVSTSEFNATYGNYDVIVKAVDDNSATPTTFTFYRMYKAASNTKFTESDEVIGVGDIITAKGVLKKYNSTYELAEGCYMVERVAFTEPKTDISNTLETAYTVDKAFELISDIKSDLDKEVYVKGLVAVASTQLYEEKYLTYSISDNGQTTGNVLKVYNGLDIGGVAFTSKYDVKVGDYVVVKGKLYNYGGTYEINKDNQLVQHKKAATITIADITMEVDETKTISATVTPEGASVSYAIKEGSDNCITLNGAEITATAAGTATIVATITETADYMGAEKEFTVTVTAVDTRKKAVSPSSFTATSGELNPNDITFTSYQGGAGNAPAIYNDGIRLYQISNGKTYGGFITLTAVKGCMIDQVEIKTTDKYSTTVAYSVDDNVTLLGSASVAKSSTHSTPAGLNTENVNILNLGTTSDNRLEIASITVYYTGQPLADPELSWTSNTVELRVGETFTAPTLNNPYSVTGITYGSNNESLAKVNVTTGAVTLVPDATGTATITAAFEGNDKYKAVAVSYTITVKPALVYGVWELVTDVNSLAAGDKVIVVAKGYEFALSTTQGNNNRGQAAVTKNNDNTVAFGKDVQVLTLEIGTVENTFALNTGKGYLYAASSGSNYLRTETTLSNNSSWAIAVSADGTATIVAKGSNTRNTMQYNQTSSVFACYGSASQQALCLYMKKNVKVEGETDNTSIPDQSDVTVDNAELTVTTEAEYDNMYIGNNGSVDVEETVTVNNLYIQTTMGTTTSGQLNTAPENLIVNGDVFIDITLGKNGDPSQWHAFTVPFPVDAANGVFDLNDKKLTNGVNYAIMQYHGDVRAQGKYGWKKYSGTLVPGTFYLMTVDGGRTTYRFKKVKDAELVAEKTKSLSAYTGGGKTTDHGWNGVGNPTLMHGKVAFDAQILDPISYTYQVIEAASAHFTVGTPFFIQAAADGAVAITAEGNSSLAPARRAAATVDKVKVMLGNADYTDYLYVSASEDATTEYEIGKDLAKMTMTSTPIVPQIFAHAYGTYLCMVNAPMISNEATVALNLYAPAEGEYTLSVEEQADATVYLLYNGNIVWNLSMGEYPIHLPQGNNAGYSLVVRRENAPTDVENIFGADEQTEKFIYNGNLYILHEGKVFDAVGNVLK